MGDFIITCISKTDHTTPHESISKVGVSGLKYTVPEVIRYIAQGDNFFVINGAKKEKVVVATSSSGHKYIKCQGDDEMPLRLLSLPTCK